MKSSSEMLRAAMRRVERGWCKGAYEDDAGNVCALGGLILENMGIEYGTGTFARARMALLEKASERGYLCIPAMNDDPATTKQDVLNLMEKAAIGLEEQGK